MRDISYGRRWVRKLNNIQYLQIAFLLLYTLRIALNLITDAMHVLIRVSWCLLIEQVDTYSPPKLIKRITVIFSLIEILKAIT
jgi:hypothetical protein